MQQFGITLINDLSITLLANAQVLDVNISELTKIITTIKRKQCIKRSFREMQGAVLPSNSLKLELTAQPPSCWFIFALTPLAINSVLMRLLRSFAIISVSDENRTRKWVTFCYQPHLCWLHWEGGDELSSRFPAAGNVTLCYSKRKPLLCHLIFWDQAYSEINKKGDHLEF